MRRSRMIRPKALLEPAVAVMNRLRYPEKFLLLTRAAVVFAGAAGLDRLLNAPAGMAKGLRHVESGPMVRSSYHAEQQTQHRSP